MSMTRRPRGRGAGSVEALVALIGEVATIRLAEAYGGTRLYVPARLADDHPIASAVGMSAASVLSKAFASSSIRVPLARDLRAEHYRQEGLSHARIAVRLGLTEGGVQSLFKRLAPPAAAHSQEHR